MHKIIHSFYHNDSDLERLLLTHSECVARKALACARKAKIACDTQFVYEAAMLHDIGIIKCNAPDILCHGSLPYICHGVAGSEMLESLGMHRHALVCERHTGSGLTINDITSQNLPLPLRDMTPHSIEEKLICYADKFFSKSGNITEEKGLERIRASMTRHGNHALCRFNALHSLFDK